MRPILLLAIACAGCGPTAHDKEQDRRLEELEAARVVQGTKNIITDAHVYGAAAAGNSTAPHK